MKNTKISINLKDLRHLKFDARYLFLVILLGVLAMSGLVARDAVSMVLLLENQVAPVADLGPGARINFTDYDYDLKRIQDGQNFTPSGGLSRNPFDPANANEPLTAPSTNGVVNLSTSTVAHLSTTTPPVTGTSSPVIAPTTTPATTTPH